MAAVMDNNRLDALVTRPREPADCRLSQAMLVDLVLTQIGELRVVDMGPLSEALGLPGTVLEPVIELLRKEGLAEVRRGITLDGVIRYGLTERGRSIAHEIATRNGYVGPAPITLDHYRDLIAAQTVRSRPIPRRRLDDALRDAVLEEPVLEKLGPALSSGRALFLYGPAGSGKTFVAKRLAQALPSPIYVPRAVAVGEKIIPIFDPLLHRTVEHSDTAHRLRLDTGHDARLLMCARPAVVTGGELSLDMLDVGYDPVRHSYQAPVQMLANNGLLLVDDLGRQQVDHERLLNRWIVPMEEGRDYLRIPAGPHFSVPFDVVLIFSTNLDPTALADEAFLRRIGHKIGFDYASRENYSRIWDNECARLGVRPAAGALDFLFETYRRNGAPMASCHPRDLITMAMDLCRFRGEPARIDPETLAWAWDNYFVRLRPTGR